jgi:hypothetical protein
MIAVWAQRDAGHVQRSQREGRFAQINGWIGASADRSEYIFCVGALYQNSYAGGLFIFT